MKQMGALLKLTYSLRKKYMLIRICGLVLFAILALPPVLRRLEMSMIGQMVVLTPLLVLSGMLLFWPDKPGNTNMKPSDFWGFPAFLFGMFIISYWMLPRALDQAVADTTTDVLRFITLPLLVGVPFVKSWPRMGMFARGFVWANTISMFIVMGWLYLASPARLCNYYLLGEQQTLGRYFLIAAIALTAYTAVGTFFGSVKSAANN